MGEAILLKCAKPDSRRSLQASSVYNLASYHCFRFTSHSVVLFSEKNEWYTSMKIPIIGIFIEMYHSFYRPVYLVLALRQRWMIKFRAGFIPWKRPCNLPWVYIAIDHSRRISRLTLDRAGWVGAKMKFGWGPLKISDYLRVSHFTVLHRLLLDVWKGNDFDLPWIGSKLIFPVPLIKILGGDNQFSGSHYWNIL